ncbi:MAG: hypothetical protein Q9162_003407 [Coniocarpon cinnabarinum]
MKEVIVSKGPSVEIKDSPVPKPGPGKVLIKIEVSGSNPKDWKYPAMFDAVANTGDDMAGYIESVGEGVVGFHKGDRVAAFHEMRTDHGSFAEYGIAWADSTFHLPPQTSFEEASTIPLAAMTAVVGLYTKLNLPEPWTGGRHDGELKDSPKPADVGPLIVYGAASAVGAFAIQLAKRSNIHPIIGVAGRGIPFVESLLDTSKGDAVVDYREGDQAVVTGIQTAAKGQTIHYCYDAISENNSYVNAANAMAEGGKITLVLPFKDFSDCPPHVEKVMTYVGDVHNANKDMGLAWFKLFEKGLRDGWLKGHPYTVVPGGLNGVHQGLTDLQNGKASATKFVFRISDTK